MNELFMVATLYAKPERADELRRDLIAVVEPSRKDEGSLRYELFVDQEDPRRFVFIEHWESEQAQRKHHTLAAHIQRFQEHGAGNVETFHVRRLTRIA